MWSPATRVPGTSRTSGAWTRAAEPAWPRRRVSSSRDRPWRGGRSWTRTGLERLARSGAAGRTQATDPAEPIGYVRNVRSGDVTRIGEETVDGASTSYYRVNVPVSALTEGDAAQAQEPGRQLGGPTPPVDLWPDGQDRMRQESLRMSPKPLARRTPGRENTRVTGTTVLKFSGFGTDADVAPPPATDTADVTGKLVSGGACTARTGWPRARSGGGRR